MALFALFLSAIGAGAGFGYLWAYNYKVEEAMGDTVPAMIGLLVLVAVAWPELVKLWEMLNGKR